MRGKIRTFVFLLFSFLFLTILFSGSPKVTVFSCREFISADYSIETEGAKSRRHTERTEYDIDYEVTFGQTENYRIRHARLLRRLDEKGSVYETGVKGGSGISAEVLNRLENHPLEVLNGTLVNPEVLPLSVSMGRDSFISAVTLSLPHRMPPNARRKTVDSVLPLPTGRLAVTLTYRRVGRMKDGERWEVVLDNVRFTLEEPYSEVLTASVEAFYLGGWALYDEEGVLLASRLQYRITFLVSQTALSPNVTFRSVVSSRVIVEKKK